MSIIINKNEKNVYEQVEENKINIKLLNDSKQELLTAGNNITIENNVINSSVPPTIMYNHVISIIITTYLSGRSTEEISNVFYFNLLIPNYSSSLSEEIVKKFIQCRNLTLSHITTNKPFILVLNQINNLSKTNSKNYLYNVLSTEASITGCVTKIEIFNDNVVES